VGWGGVRGAESEGGESEGGGRCCACDRQRQS
jgi:hypothetical protein